MELARELGAKDILFPSSYYPKFGDEYLDILEIAKLFIIRPKVLLTQRYLAKFGIAFDEKSYL